METTPTVDKEIDTRGLNCPLPILRAKKALSDMTSGQVLKILATDPGSVRDFQAFARQTGNELRRAGDRRQGIHSLPEATMSTHSCPTTWLCTAHHRAARPVQAEARFLAGDRSARCWLSGISCSRSTGTTRAANALAGCRSSARRAGSARRGKAKWRWSRCPAPLRRSFSSPCGTTAVAQQINRVMGKRVTLHYDEKVGLPTSASARRATS